MSHAFFGPNGMTLVAMGKIGLVLWANLLAAGANVVLNIILIPQWGINGAAFALLVSYLILNVFFSAKLYQLSKIHPFTKSYLKPILASGTIIAVIHVLTRSVPVVSYWMLPLIFILFLGVYGLCLVLTKSFDKEDIMILTAVGKRMGINVEPARRILEKFL
jgi:O-antigen/teichoic acid export membrane protein